MNFQHGFTLAGHLPTILDGPVGLPRQPIQRSDEEWMQVALLFAMRGMGLSQPNPSVGAIAVKAGRIIGAGCSQEVGGLHAERMALSPLLKTGAAEGATLYSTLEPCSHHGRQPPCTDIIVQSGIRRCVTGAKDHNPVVNGTGIQLLKKSGVCVRTDILRDECVAWHLSFLAPILLKRPMFAAKWAQTLNGQLCFGDGQRRWISGEKSSKYTHWLRQRYDAILIGAGTALSDTPTLNVRVSPFKTHRDPIRLIFDPRKRILNTSDFSAKAVDIFHRKSPVAYLTSSDLDDDEDDKCRLLQDQHGVVVAHLEGERHPVDALPGALEDLFQRDRISRKIESVLIEGGPSLHSLFFSRNLVDVAHVYVAPFLGGKGGRSVTSDRILGGHMHLTGTYRMGNDGLMEFLSPALSQALFSESNQELEKHFVTARRESAL